MTAIGVFDSGFGGLTVLRSLLALVPSARYIYLGDTARLPYGSKSRETIARYAVSSARFLLEQGAELLVIACNTATALALEDIRIAVHPIPVIGVIEPGAHAAAAVINSDRPPFPLGEARQPTSASLPAPAQVLVLATAATVHSHAYTRALAHLGIPAAERASPLLVPLIEEGWIDHHVTREVARIYLSEALTEHPSVTTLLLGCTHYPLLRNVFAETLASLDRPLAIIDSAEATAHTVATQLQTAASSSASQADCTFFATDSVEKFRRLGSQFLGQSLSEVHLISLES